MKNCSERVLSNLKKYPNLRYTGESVSLEKVNELKDLQYLISVPSDFFEKLESFAERNIVHSAKNLTRENIKKGKICLRCLKAFILDKSKELQVPKESVQMLLLPFQCELGHENCYLDNGKLNCI